LKGINTNSDLIWYQIEKNIRKTVLTEPWTEQDWNSSPLEAIILDFLGLLQNLQLTSSKTSPPHLSSPLIWSPPPAGFIKLNFNGASKGNPGLERLGGVFRDHKAAF
jgi:hypothetical protein